MTADNQAQFTKKPLLTAYYNVDYKLDKKGQCFMSLYPIHRVHLTMHHKPTQKLHGVRLSGVFGQDGQILVCIIS